MRLCASCCWFCCMILSSARSSCCSLLAAEAGHGASRTAPTNTAAMLIRLIVSSPRISRSLAGKHELGPAVLGPCRFVVAGVEREFLAIAHGPQSIRRQAQRDQIGPCRHRASLAERQVVLGGPALVGVSLD